MAIDGYEGGTRSPPAKPHRLQNPIWPPGGPKMSDGVWKRVYPQVFGHSKQLNKFFDPSTPSMRKGRDGEKKRETNGGKQVRYSYDAKLIRVATGRYG